MGRKKRKSDQPSVPIFHIKKQKLAAETRLTAVVALHKYAQKFKLGQPGYREKVRCCGVGVTCSQTTVPFTISVVINGSELGTAQHGEREAAIEKASLVTLHLLDPDGKSIVANITHSNEAELKALCSQITNAKQDEIQALTQSAQSAPPPPNPFGLTPFNPFVPPWPMPQFPPQVPLQLPPVVRPQPPVPPPIVAPVVTRTDDGLVLAFDNLDESPEELRAKKYGRQKQKVIADPTDDPDALEALFEEVRAQVHTS